MKKLIIILISLILLIIFFFGIVNENRVIVDNVILSEKNWDKSNKKMMDLTQNELKKNSIKMDLHSEINNQGGISGVRNDKEYDIRYIGIDSIGKNVNIFVRFEISLLNIKLTKLVIEKSGLPETDLESLKGEYNIILGEGYERIINVIKGP